MGRFNDEFPNMTKAQFIEHWTRTVATQVHAKRLQLGMTQAELALASGVHPSTIVNVESGGHQAMAFDIFLSACYGLETMPAELVGFVNLRPKVSPAEYQLVLAARKLFTTT